MKKLALVLVLLSVSAGMAFPVGFSASVDGTSVSTLTSAPNAVQTVRQRRRYRRIVRRERRTIHRDRRHERRERRRIRRYVRHQYRRG
jgi:hypothetical protein